MPLEMRSSSAFCSEIQEVVVHKVSRVWEFRFAFAEVLPLLCLRNCASAWRTNFQRRETKRPLPSKWRIGLSEDLLQAYYREVFEDGPCASQGFEGFTKTCRCAEGSGNWSSQGLLQSIQSIFVRIICLTLPNSWKPLVFRVSTCRVESDEGVDRARSGRFEQENEKIFQAANEERPCGLWNPWPRWLRHQRLKKNQPGFPG